MPIPPQHLVWAGALKMERPWEDNITTQTLLERTGDRDISAVLWALARTNALNWIDREIPDLGGQRIEDALATSDGKTRVWQVLQAAVAWL